MSPKTRWLVSYSSFGFVETGVVSGIYDDRFLVKPTKSAVTMMPNADMELSYDGTKEMLFVDDVDNKEFLREVFEKMYEELPVPKKKKK